MSKDNENGQGAGKLDGIVNEAAGVAAAGVRLYEEVKGLGLGGLLGSPREARATLSSLLSRALGSGNKS